MYEKETNIVLSFALKQDTEAHPLSSLELCWFSGNPVPWTEFIKTFCNKIQLKVMLMTIFALLY